MSKVATRTQRTLRLASTGHAPEHVQVAAVDLFECAHALSDDPTSVVAMRQLLDAAFCVVHAARNHAKALTYGVPEPSSGEKP